MLYAHDYAIVAIATTPLDTTFKVTIQHHSDI